MNLQYTTTRMDETLISSSQAILNGLGPDGGLYLPMSIPNITREDLATLSAYTYNEKAEYILSRFLTDFTKEEIHACVSNAYNETTFSDPLITPLHHLDNESAVLELYHGPTSAFKDVALQILPYLLTTSAHKNGDNRTYVILVATSGDTGKAALEGFKNVPNTRILVYYPSDGVSLVQKLQMATQAGDNLKVLSVKGNFDDTQNGVKALFNDKELIQQLEAGNLTFSSANSINWGRLVPQIVYYFDSYLQLVAKKKIHLGDEVNFTVPTGNFGNILAGYYAKAMGLPIGRLLCAANSNDVLKDFIQTGIYDKNRPFMKTLSPSMDILISSNLERLLFLLSGMNKSMVSDYMKQLATTGVYAVSAELRKTIGELFYSASQDDLKTIETIRRVYNRFGYLMDTHTAVAYGVYEQYRQETGDRRFNVIVSTASPYKFNRAVGEAILPNREQVDEIALLEEIQTLTGVTIPQGLRNLDQKPLRFKEVIEKDEMKSALLSYLTL